MNGAANPSVSAPDPFLRIKAGKVAQLLDLVGEMGLAVLAITRHPALVGLDLEGFENSAHRLEMLTREVQDLASGLRLVPASQVFGRMQRLVRDLSIQVGKPLEIVTEGEDIEIDKAIVDQLGDPLLHLIRNAADHGIESAEDRRRAGKPETGRITLTAAQLGQEIRVSVADDGRGLDREAILRKAVASGRIAADAQPADEEVWKFIFEAGFSTSASVSNLSGRGVGMDVVQTAVRALRGRISVRTVRGEGTTVNLLIPVTLAFLESMVVRSDGHHFAIPIESVSEVFQPDAAHVVRASAEGEELVRRQEALIPVYRVGASGRPLEEQIILVVQSSRGKVGLPVDGIVGQQQVMMKPLSGHLREIQGGAGCALLGSGEVAVALDVERLLDKAAA